MFIGPGPRGGAPPDPLIVRDCGKCGQPTVFAAPPPEGALCAGCAGLPVERDSTQRSCPVDNTLLVPEQASGVTIDRCPSCHGVWLDAGELDLIIRGARSMALERRSDALNLLLNVLADKDAPKGSR